MTFGISRSSEIFGQLVAIDKNPQVEKVALSRFSDLLLDLCKNQLFLQDIILHPKDNKGRYFTGLQIRDDKTDLNLPSPLDCEKAFDSSSHKAILAVPIIGYASFSCRIKSNFNSILSQRRPLPFLIFRAPF